MKAIVSTYPLEAQIVIKKNKSGQSQIRVICGNRQCQQWNKPLAHTLRSFDTEFKLTLPLGYKFDPQVGAYIQQVRSPKRSTTAFQIRQRARDIVANSLRTDQQPKQSEKPVFSESESEAIELSKKMKAEAKYAIALGRVIQPTILSRSLKEQPLAIHCHRCRRLNIVKYTAVIRAFEALSAE